MRFILPAIGLLAVCSAGCDTGTYGARFDQRKAELTRRSDIARHLYLGTNPIEKASEESPGISIRLPAFFDDGAGYMKQSDARSDPNRAQPPGIPLPGFSFSFEKYLEAPSGKWLPVYAYFGSRPVADVTEDELKSDIEARINKLFTSNRKSWSQLDIVSLGGDKKKWYRIKIIGAQQFVAKDEKDAEKGQNQMYEGHLQFFMHTTPYHHVVAAFRAPAEIADQVEFLEAAEACLATLSEE